MTRLSSKNQRYVSYLPSFEPLLCHPLLFGAVPVPLVTAMTRMSSLAIEIEIAFFPVSDSPCAITHDIRCHRPTPTCHVEHWRACCYRSCLSTEAYRVSITFVYVLTYCPLKVNPKQEPKPFSLLQLSLRDQGRTLICLDLGDCFFSGDATVTIAHRCTPREQLKELTSLADIIIAAAGNFTP